MGRFEIRFRPSVRKDLRGIPGPDVRRILQGIDGLSNDPRPSDCKKLTGRDLYRIRSGVYRVVYEVHDREVVVIVVKIGHRRDVYEP
jgi:mRNA interferase RelE/StbE